MTNEPRKEFSSSDSPAQAPRPAREDGARRPYGPRKHFAPRRKVCRLCAEKVAHIDYKQVSVVKSFCTDGGKILVGYRTLFEGITKDIAKGLSRGTVSAKFHNTIAQIIAEVCSRVKRSTRIDKVVLSGGVFQNKYLTTKAAAILRKRGFKVFLHSKVNTNDSGIPIGQIAIARTRCA